MRVYLDIETSGAINPNQLLLDNIRANMKPDGRAKDPEASKVEKFFKFIEDAPLEPLLAEIIAISFAVNDEEPICYIQGNGLDESNILFNFAAEIHTQATITEDFIYSLVTFNGQSFDLPILRLRLAKHGIHIPGVDWNPSKYDFTNHFDVRSALTNFDQYGRGTLDQWALYFGLEISSDRRSGKEIPEMFTAGLYDEIVKKGKEDIKLLRGVFTQIYPYF